jgi:nitroreductase
MTDIFEVIHAQRACRSFLDSPVEDALIERLLDAATFAPSAENLQPWVFIVVADSSRRGAIASIAKRVWASGARSYSESRLTPALMADVERGITGGIESAPVIIVVAADTSLSHARAVPSSVFPAVQNLMLAATAVGLGTTLMTLPATDELPALLDLPLEIAPMAVIPVGWPARPLQPPRRRPFAATTYRNSYGVVW